MSSAPQKGWALLVEGGKRDGVIPPGPTVPVLAFTTEAERDEAANSLATLELAGLIAAACGPDSVAAGQAAELATLRTRLAEAERLLGELAAPGASFCCNKDACAGRCSRCRARAFLQGESEDG